MGKSTYAGLVPKDHPMFSGGAETFSRLASRAYSTSTPSATDGGTPPSQDSAPQEVDPMQGAADIIEKGLANQHALYMARSAVEELGSDHDKQP